MRGLVGARAVNDGAINSITSLPRAHWPRRPAAAVRLPPQSAANLVARPNNYSRNLPSTNYPHFYSGAWLPGALHALFRER